MGYIQPTMIVATTCIESFKSARQLMNSGKQVHKIQVSMSTLSDLSTVPLMEITFSVRVMNLEKEQQVIEAIKYA